MKATPYTPELGQAVARLVAGGYSLAHATTALHVDIAAARRWEEQEPHFARFLGTAKYLKATNEAETLLGDLGQRRKFADVFAFDLDDPDEIPDAVPELDDAVLEHDTDDVVQPCAPLLERGAISGLRFEQLHSMFECYTRMAFVLYEGVPHIAQYGSWCALEVAS